MKKMLKKQLTNIKTWVIFILLLILLLTKCGGDSPKVITETITTTEYDTLHIHHTDTIKFIDTIERIVYVPVNKPIEVFGNEGIGSLEYHNPFEDSLISGTIFSRVKLDGTMVKQEFKYTPKFPQYIVNTDTFYITKIINNTTTITTKPKMKLLVGTEIGGNETSFSLKALGGFKNKRGTNFFYSYDFINKQHGVGVLYPLTFKKK